MAQDKSRKPFLQFPICLLAYGDTVRERLSDILHYSAVDNSLRVAEKISDELASDYWSRAHIPDDLDSLLSRAESPEERIRYEKIIIGSKKLGIQIYNLSASLQRYERVKRYVDAFEQRHGTDARTRVLRDWAFEVRDGSGMNYDEFAVVAAVHSVLGRKAKKPVRIKLNTIRRRAAGYRSKAIYDAERQRMAKEGRLVTAEWPWGWKTAKKKNQLYTYADAVTYMHYCTFEGMSIDGERGLFDTISIAPGAGCVYQLREGAPEDTRNRGQRRANLSRAFSEGDRVTYIEREEDQVLPRQGIVTETSAWHIYADVDGRRKKLSNGQYLITPTERCQGKAENVSSEDIDLLLSRQQARTLVKKMDTRECYNLCTLFGNRMYFGRGFESNDALRGAVTEAVVYKDVHQGKQRQKDRAMDERIKEIRRQARPEGGENKDASSSQNGRTNKEGPRWNRYAKEGSV